MAGKKQAQEKRPRKSAKSGRKSARKSAARPAAGARVEPLLTLLQIGQMTGISYPTLLRYVRLHIDRLPHVGTGRKRRFHPQAVAVFQELREESRRGRSAGGRARSESNASIEKRLERLETSQRRLAAQLKELERVLKRPMRITLQR